MVLQTQIIFGDLRDTYSELSTERYSPVSVRRSFGRFIDLSQKLTSAMRRDFSREKGLQWEAAKFHGWNDVTNFFKRLRNYDQHEFPIQIQVHQRNFYSIEEGSDQRLVIEGTWALGDPFSKAPPKGMKIVTADPMTGKPSEVEVFPREIEYEYFVHASEESLEKNLSRLGTKNVHVLSQQCYEVLNNYFEFFCEEMRKV